MLNVQLITADFEVAMWQSVRATMPGVRLVGCLFHYCQALYRHLQTIGLQRAYQTGKYVDSDTKQVATCVFKMIDDSSVLFVMCLLLYFRCWN